MAPDTSFILFLCFSVGLALSVPAIRVYRALWG